MYTITMSHFQVITPVALHQKPTSIEYTIAEITAQFFKSNVRFIEPRCQRAPDLYVTKTRKTWEIKNIKGNSKRTIANNLRSAKYQSPNIIISLMASKMSPAQAAHRILEYLKSGPSGIQSVILITKSEKILVIK